MNEKYQFPLDTAKKELNSINNEIDLIDSILQIINAKTQLIESIYEGKPELKEGEVFIETLSMKILLATKSILEISKGFHLETANKKGTHKLLDFSSINILTRSIIESFLTLEYLFYNDLEDKEKEFRFIIWRISGYKSRQNFFDSDDLQKITTEFDQKLLNEYDELTKLLIQAKEYEYFNSLDKHSLWKLDKFGLPRMKSWGELLENSKLNKDFFLKPYKLYSNYAHSEFISLTQMNGSEILIKGGNENNLHLINALRVVKMINCISIILLSNKFKCTCDSFQKLRTKEKELIQFWYNIGTGVYD